MAFLRRRVGRVACSPQQLWAPGLQDTTGAYGASIHFQHLFEMGWTGRRLNTVPCSGPRRLQSLMGLLGRRNQLQPFLSDGRQWAIVPMGGVGARGQACPTRAYPALASTSVLSCRRMEKLTSFDLVSKEVNFPPGSPPPAG